MSQLMGASAQPRLLGTGLAPAGGSLKKKWRTGPSPRCKAEQACGEAVIHRAEVPGVDSAASPPRLASGVPTCCRRPAPSARIHLSSCAVDSRASSSVALHRARTHVAAAERRGVVKDRKDNERRNEVHSCAELAPKSSINAVWTAATRTAGLLMRLQECNQAASQLRSMTLAYVTDRVVWKVQTYVIYHANNRSWWKCKEEAYPNCEQYSTKQADAPHNPAR
jgi:hypothetical protein